MLLLLQLTLNLTGVFNPYVLLIGLGLGLIGVAVWSLVYQWRHVRHATQHVRKDDPRRR